MLGRIKPYDGWTISIIAVEYKQLDDMVSIQFGYRIKVSIPYPRAVWCLKKKGLCLNFSSKRYDKTGRMLRMCNRNSPK